MINNFRNVFKNLERQTIHIIKSGIKFCAFMCVLSLLVLLIYDFGFPSPHLFDIGITLFKMSILFSVEFLICGIVVDALKKRLI